MAFEKLKSKVRSRSDPQKDKGAVVVFSLDDFDKYCDIGYTKLENNTDVQACIKTIADLISTMTIMLMENTDRGDRRVKNGLSRKVDINPYSFGTRKTLMFTAVRELLLSGNSILLPKIRNGYLDDLTPIPDAEYSFMPTGDGYAIRYKGEVFAHDEIIHFVNNPDRHNPWRGEPYKVYLKDVIENLNTTQKVKKKFYTKDYKPNVMFYFNADSDDFQSLEGRDELLKKWVETGEGKPYILPAGLLDAKTIPAMSISDLAINDSVTLDKKAVCGVFGVPPFLLGIGIYNQREWNNFINRTIFPICTGLAQELTRKLIYHRDWYFTFNLKSIMAFDFEARVSAFFNGRKIGAVSPNEVRLVLDLEPIDDPIMDKISILENYIPIEDIGNQSKLNKITDDPGGDK